jgi:rare lipoprotein A (peptidoglycan hydrolase)
MRFRNYVIGCILILLLGFILGALIFHGGRVPVAQITINLPPEIQARLDDAALCIQRAYYVMTRVEMLLGTKTNVMVSWYGPGFHGKKTSSGELYDMYAFTCAHRYYPIGTRIQFYCPRTGRYAIARVNDYGPALQEREFDISFAVATKLGLIEPGVDICETTVIGI